MYPVAMDDLVVIQRPEGFVIALVTSSEIVLALTNKGFEYRTNQLEVAWHDTVMKIPPKDSRIGSEGRTLTGSGQIDRNDISNFY
jgi:hypothetical protein